jgi:ABC-type glycerol-3-phosphate transport system permease component
LRQQGSSDAAEDDLGPPRMAVGADDDQIHAAVYGAGENDFADRRSIRCRLFDVDVHAVAGEEEPDVVLLGVVLLIWSLLPVYNMLLIALDPEEGEIEFAGNLWPAEPSLDGFRDVVTQEARYLEDFWHQFGNSLYIGLSTMVLTVLIGSLASFAVSRLRLSKGSLLTNTALLTYAIPASFLIVPYYRIMHGYGLSDNLWAVIAAQVTFATPFAILILQLYASFYTA